MPTQVATDAPLAAKLAVLDWLIAQKARTLPRFRVLRAPLLVSSTLLKSRMLRCAPE
jgi:hypothetical protein